MPCTPTSVICLQAEDTSKKNRLRSSGVRVYESNNCQTIQGTGPNEALEVDAG